MNNTPFFKPIDRMWERVDISREDSDTSLGLALSYMGEMVTKLAAAGLIAAIADDPERLRYSQLYKLVRAESLGDWATSIDDVLTGPPAQYLIEPAYEEQKDLTQRSVPDTWQYHSVNLLFDCLELLNLQVERQPKIDGRRWFSAFVRFRNKTRAHGAIKGDLWGELCPRLEESLTLFTENFRLFRRPWAFLYRNLSGKYRVTRWNDSNAFEYLKSERNITLQNGVYISFGLQPPHRAELVASDVEATDYYLPNGAFDDKNKRYEQLSYVTGNRLEGDSSPYLAPATTLPASETEGLGTLDAQGNCFGNLPPAPTTYVSRPVLENQLHDVLTNDRHPVITLVGRGGIGKTWLALWVLHQLTQTEQFTAIIWFSARDIDLLPQGPKLVQPHVLTEVDIARMLTDMLTPPEAQEKGFNKVQYLASTLNRSTIGPILFVFDNFETVRSPAGLFQWIDNYIRLPNKVLITTRHRDFKGDYPVEVQGMTNPEFDELVASTSESLGISDLLTTDFLQELYRESDGHPYVVKVLLGEVAKADRIMHVERIAAGKEQILEALFERTYSGLSPVAQRVFLTLSSWRSTVPQLAVEAVLLRPANERMDISEGIEELRQSSFLEVTASEDDHPFLTVPLVAALFGLRKLQVSPWKSAIEADLLLLRAFGASQQSDIRYGIAPRVRRMFEEIASRVAQRGSDLQNYLPVLEFVAREYPPAWMWLAKLHEESSLSDGLNQAIQAVNLFLESSPDSTSKQQGWMRLAELYRRNGQQTHEVHALVEVCKLPDVPFSTVSATANQINSLSRQQDIWDYGEKRVIAQTLATIMETRVDEANATDCSRLAWLYMHLQDRDKARYYAELGLEHDPTNDYCLRLANSLYA